MRRNRFSWVFMGVAAMIFLIVAAIFWLDGPKGNRETDALILGIIAIFFFAASFFMYTYAKRNV